MAEQKIWFLDNFLRYVLLGVWLVLGAPWIFRIMRLAPAAR